MSRRAPLFCQHLENISDGLDKYQDAIRAFVRHRHGVYALYERKKLYYAGLAKDLRWRLKTHLNDRHKESWDRFSVYLTIGDGEDVRSAWAARRQHPVREQNLTTLRLRRGARLSVEHATAGSSGDLSADLATG